ncbi:MAG: cytidine deaminase [Bacillota bacterium]
MPSDAELISMALAAREGAYAPYSGIRVGAALRARDGAVFTGANVENSSYGLTICAERVAAAKAVTAGHRDFAALAVAWNREGFCRPCGACRQVLIEFGPSMRLLMANARGEYEEERLEALLPRSFGI